MVDENFGPIDALSATVPATSLLVSSDQDVHVDRALAVLGGLYTVGGGEECVLKTWMQSWM